MELDYIGRAPCGCIKIWLMGDGHAASNKRELAKEVAKIVRLGLSLERIDTETAKKEPMFCSVCRPETQGLLQ